MFVSGKVAEEHVLFPLSKLSKTTSRSNGNAQMLWELVLECGECRGNAHDFGGMYGNAQMLWELVLECGECRGNAHDFGGMYGNARECVGFRGMRGMHRNAAGMQRT